MNPAVDAVLRSWRFDPWLLVPLLLTALVYLRGWLTLRRWHAGHLAAFFAGLFAIFLAVASPIDTFSPLLLSLHMVQHLLLMMAAPPLLWLGEPMIPLLRGLPRPIRTVWVAPLFRSPALQRLFTNLTSPLPAWLIFTAVTWGWHTPPAYELALGSETWHHVEHASFLIAALLFWFPVVRPYPAKPRWSLWALIPYLLLADVQNTALSAVLTFSGNALYPHYESMPRLWGISAVDDQATAGVIMWVPGSVAFLLPLMWVGVKIMFGGNPSSSPLPRLCGGEGAGVRGACVSRDAPAPLTPALSPRKAGGRGSSRISLPLVAPPRPQTVRRLRPVLQIVLFLLAILLIWDGLAGPQVAPLNLAGVVPWIHWRGILILTLLALGNFFCMACPFMLPRTLARRLVPRGRPFPRWLRSKWPAVALLLVFLWAYEAFSLWNSPALTAGIIIAYFVSAFLIDSLFRDAAFCKYVCPVGQFNFVQSLLSLLEVKVRDRAVCGSCSTKDCIRGRDNLPGCELHLFLPRKSGNMDCTFCLDCVRACPHDNVGILPVTPDAKLWRDPQRSGIGRFSKRPDLAALVLVLVFGAFANAAGMVAPVADWLSTFLRTTGYTVLALVVIPVLSVGFVSFVSRRWGRLEKTWLETATRFSFALIPLGFGMWLAHYGFHLLTGYDAILPAAQRFATDHGITGLASPDFVCACCRPVGSWVVKLEIVCLDIGLLLSLYTAYRIAVARTPQTSLAMRALVPWAVLIVLLFACGIWIVLQPMQMRGTLAG